MKEKKGMVYVFKEFENVQKTEVLLKETNEGVFRGEIKSSLTKSGTMYVIHFKGQKTTINHNNKSPFRGAIISVGGESEEEIINRYIKSFVEAMESKTEELGKRISKRNMLNRNDKRKIKRIDKMLKKNGY